jgi:signal transduction histidine kinase
MTTATGLELALANSQHVLREVAHEIRQPLSVIESIAYYLALVSADDDKNREQFMRIQELVEQSNWILSSGVGLVETRRAEPVPVDLDELITQTLSGRPASIDSPVELALEPDLPLVHLDPGFARTLIENILGLFRQLATTAQPLEIRTFQAASGIEIQFFTAAQGYRSLTSLPPGSTMSLDYVQRIAAMHGGSSTISIDPQTGIRLRVMLP